MNPTISFFVYFEFSFVVALYAIAILAAFCACVYWGLKEPSDLREPLI